MREPFSAPISRNCLPPGSSARRSSEPGAPQEPLDRPLRDGHRDRKSLLIRRSIAASSHSTAQGCILKPRRSSSAASSFWRRERMMSRSRGRNTTTRSRRLRNSGRKVCWTARSTEPGAKSSSSLANPSRCPVLSDEPMFDVRMITVWRKSTVRPCCVVRRPSSKTCRKMSQMFSCAFSNSSSKHDGERLPPDGRDKACQWGLVGRCLREQALEALGRLEFAHVDPDEPACGPEEIFSEGFGELGLARPRRPHEKKDAERSRRVGKPRLDHRDTFDQASTAVG